MLALISALSIATASALIIVFKEIAIPLIVLIALAAGICKIVDCLRG